MAGHEFFVSQPSAREGSREREEKKKEGTQMHDKRGNGVLPNKVVARMGQNNQNPSVHPRRRRGEYGMRKKKTVKNRRDVRERKKIKKNRSRK